MRISDWSSDVCSSDLDVQVRGRDMAGNQAYAHKLLKRLRSVPGLADARIQQSMRYPQIDVDVDRARMAQYGLDQRDVTQSLGLGLAGTSQSAPVFFLNPENGVSYSVVAPLLQNTNESLTAHRTLTFPTAPHGHHTTTGGPPP